MRKHTAVFANFICKFGERNLVDYLEEIVLPAFTNDTLVREYSSTRYFFFEVKLINLGSHQAPAYAIAGKFVKEYNLKREQIFDDRTNSLKSDEQQMETAPSAFFLLLLAEHRLVYFAETQSAPNLKAFQSTIARFAMNRWREFVSKIHAERNKNESSRVTWDQIYAEHPAPRITVIPIAGHEETSKFVKRFSKLTRFEVTVHERNEEVDGAELMESLNGHNKDLAGEQTKVVTTASGDGLDRRAAAKKVADITRAGNQSVRLVGTDQDGLRLTGENNDFSIVAEIEIIAAKTIEKAQILYKKFKELVASGTVAAGTASADVRAKIAKVASEYL